MKTNGYYGIVSRDDKWIQYKLRDNREARRFYRKPYGGGQIIAVGYRLYLDDIPTDGWTLNYGGDGGPSVHAFGFLEPYDIPAWAREIVKGNITQKAKA